MLSEIIPTEIAAITTSYIVKVSSCES